MDVHMRTEDDPRASGPDAADPVWSIERVIDSGPPEPAGWVQESGRCVVAFDVDRDDPARFPFVQHGPLDADHGWREHRLELVFALPAEPVAEYTLRLTLHAAIGPCPELAVEVGPHRGVFYPRIWRPRRDAVFGTGPIAGDANVDVGIPGSWLRSGVNRVAITTVCDAPFPDEEKRRRAHDSGAGSGLIWESLALVVAACPPDVDVEVRATPFYICRPGGLCELVDVTVRVPAGGSWPSAGTLSANGVTTRWEMARQDRDFGEVRARVAVPELSGPTTARIEAGELRREVELRPFRKWTLHLVPHVHLDVGFTDFQGKVLELHSRNLDRALALRESDPSFRFAADGALIVGEFLATRSPKQCARLVEAMQGGRISVNAFHSLFLSGLPTLEECYRFAYLSAAMRSELEVPVDYANLTDVPSYTMALPSVLQALGIDAFFGIENHGRAANADSERQHLISPVQWEGPDGARVLAFFSDQYSQLRHMIGDPQTMAGADQAFDRYLSRYERADYLPADLPIVGSHVDNEDLAGGDIDLVDRWNAKYAWPRLRISTFTDYLNAVRPLADRLPVWRGDGGSYWEDGVGAAATAMIAYRQAQMLLPLAENLAALTALASPITRPHRAALDAGWDALLIGSEHTWTWAHAYQHPHGEQGHDQEAWKRHRIQTAYRTGADELRRAMSRLGELIATTGPTLIVYNGLSWRRTVDAEVDLPAGTTVGADLPRETLASATGLDRVRVSVPDVPAFGYRALPLRHDADADAPLAPWQPLSGPELATERWQVTLDPGTGRVLGLRHRPTGRQLLDSASPWSLGEVLYVTAGDETNRHDPSRLIAPDVRLPEPALEITAVRLRPFGVRRTCDGWRLRAAGSAPSLPNVEIDILLRDTSDRVDVAVTLDKQRVLAREAVYIAFPFAAEQPRVRWDRQQGWVDPTVDHTPGACNDWFTTQYAVTINDRSGAGVVWTSADAPLFVVGDVLRGRWASEFHADTGTLLSWPMNNYWSTNYPPSQGGAMTLRYAFRPTTGFDPLAASRFGREVRTPAAVSEVTWLDKDDTGARPLDPVSAALIDLELPETVTASVFQARHGDGLIVRLQDLAGRAGPIALHSPYGPHTSATLCHADERPRSQLSPDHAGRVSVQLPAHGAVTLLFRPSAP